MHQKSANIHFEVPIWPLQTACCLFPNLKKPVQRQNVLEQWVGYISCERVVYSPIKRVFLGWVKEVWTAQS
jgi:hypothetical protein